MNASLVLNDALLHRHGVAIGGHDGPCENANTFAFADWAEVRLASVTGADARHDRGAATCCCVWVNERQRVGVSIRPAVHRRVVVTRHVKRRDDVLG